MATAVGAEAMETETGMVAAAMGPGTVEAAAAAAATAAATTAAAAERRDAP
jgi:hypothetical protein